MSATTPNLSLTLYDSTTDQSVTFATFRAVWGGTATTSNFYKIDTWAGTVNSSITSLQNQRGAITVNAGYVSANYYEAVTSSISSYITGMTILLNLDTDSNGTVTLNINSLGTKSVMKINTSGTPVNISGGDLQSGRYYLFTYDGTRWVWVDATSSDQVYISGTSGDVVVISSTNTLESSGLRPLVSGYDGFIDNYTILPSISSNNLTVAIKGMDGNDPSSTNVVRMRNGNSVLNLTSALSLTITAAMGDIFAWDARKVQGNDAQIFVYLINNNGTLQVGVSPSPNLTTVATNYYDIGSGVQTGATGFTNIVMSGTRNATNSCRVIGRINVYQLDNNNWQSPTTSKINNQPIWNTDWMNWTPIHSRTGGAYSNAPSVSTAKYMIENNLLHWRENHTQNATPGSSGYQVFTEPVKAVVGFTGSGWNTSTSVQIFPFADSLGNITLYKYDGTAECTAGVLYASTGFYEV